MLIIDSLNVSLPGNKIFHGKEVRTGICKEPLSGPIPLGFLGFEGDGVADTKHHGRDRI